VLLESQFRYAYSRDEHFLLQGRWNAGEAWEPLEANGHALA